MTTSRVSMTPQGAQEILDENPVARRSWSYWPTETFVSTMRAGRWQNRPNAHIIFGTNGQLIDGRQVLTAIVRSGCTIDLGIEHDYPSDEIDVLTAPDLTHDQLVTALRNQAHGLYADEAAVELLIADSHWLRSNRFRHYIRLTELFAWPCWEDIQSALDQGTLPGTDSELGVLRFAIDLAQGRLGSWLTSVDSTRLTLVLQAIAHVGGWHERNIHATVTGHLSTR